MADFMAVDATDGRRIVMGPCPGCNDWSVSFLIGEDPELVESVLNEHAMWECPALLRLSLDVFASLGRRNS